MDLKEITDKLIGNINPIGETNADERYFKNLETQIELVDQLINDIRDVSKNNFFRGEASMAKAGTKATRYLEDLTLELGEDYGN